MNNKTGVLAAFVTFACLVALGIIGYIVLTLIKPEKSDQYFAVLLQLLGLASLAGGYFWGQGRQNQKIELIKKQTNGTLSSVIERNDALASKNNTLETERSVLQKEVEFLRDMVKGNTNHE